MDMSPVRPCDRYAHEVNRNAGTRLLEVDIKASMDWMDTDEGRGCCVAEEREYRRGYRDGWIQATETVLEIPSHQKRLVYWVMWEHWERELALWQSNPDVRECISRCHEPPELTRKKAHELLKLATEVSKSMGARSPTKLQRIRILANRDGWACGICKQPIEEGDAVQIDHRVPKSLGGGNEIENLQLAHFHCNMKKRNFAREND